MIVYKRYSNLLSLPVVYLIHLCIDFIEQALPALECKADYGFFISFLYLILSGVENVKSLLALFLFTERSVSITIFII